MSAKKYKGKELYPHLFTPIRIGNIRLKNRIIAAPTSPSMVTNEGFFTPEMIAYLEEKAKGGISSLFSSSIFSGLFPSGKIPFLSSLSLPKIGTEEILIIAAAAYLFFSKDGDKECAIMLILLLFVN